MTATRPEWLTTAADRLPLSPGHLRDAGVVLVLLGLITVGSVRVVLGVGRAVLGVRR